MTSTTARGALRAAICTGLIIGSVLASNQVSAGTIAMTRQDTPVAFPAYRFDTAGNPLGTSGPQGGSNIIQDVAYDAVTGDLWALIVDANNASGTTIANLSQNTSFSAGQSVFFDRGANIAAHGGTITMTRQDVGAVSGSLPAYRYDSAGNSLGTIGPQRDSNFIQDITYDAVTGDLWALIVDANNAAATAVTNLTQNTSFLAGQSVFSDRGANIAVHNGAATITRQDLGAISGSLPAYQYDSSGSFLGTIGPQGDANFIQDIAFDGGTGDLWALIVDGNNASGTTITNLTQGTGFLAGQSVFADRGANITVFSSGTAVPAPATLLLLCAGLLGLGLTKRSMIGRPGNSRPNGPKGS